MSDRMKEMKGNLKEGAGKMLGDREMQAEGAGERDAARMSRRVKGAGNAAKGTLEETAGAVTGDETMRSKGVADRTKGKAQRAG